MGKINFARRYLIQRGRWLDFWLAQVFNTETAITGSQARRRGKTKCDGGETGYRTFLCGVLGTI